MPDDRPKQNGLLAISLIATLAVGSWLLVDGSRTTAPPQPSGSDAFQSAPPTPHTAAVAPLPGAAGHAAPVPAKSAPPAPQPMGTSAPVRIRIPVIGVNAPMIALGLDSTGHLDVPPDENRNLAGWFKGGPTPGSAGNALIDGHVDTMKGPAVFYGLGALHKGDAIDVDRQDGSEAVFSIDAIEVYAKASFPDAKVYDPTSDPQLRVITCGGGFSRSSGYLGNVVVYAHLSASRASAG
ncbi:class F sortase [Streptacidiphilus sp. EB129]|uniref:class F sortase n=1 Tax=Streptacidiphilus sp. EB129 TaxID=3156262 RepID=UPI0035116948